MKKKKYKGGVAKSLFKNYFIGYILLVVIMVFILMVTFFSDVVRLFYPSSEKYQSINNKLSKNYTLITEEELQEINGFLVVVDKDNKISYKRGEVIKEFEKITLNEYILLFNSSKQLDSIDQIENYAMKSLESILAISNLESTLIKSENGLEYSIYYRYVKYNNQLVIFGVPYENINKYGNFDAKSGYGNGIATIVVFNILMMLVLLYIFAKWTARRFVKPINVLNKGMKLITEGHYGEKVNLKTANEFEELADGFNLMSRTIKEEKEENIRLQQKRNELILHISHDLKNPLSSILGYSDILNGENTLTKVERDEYLNIISKNSKRANKIITDLFEFSLLDSADYKLNLRKLDINELLREILADYIPELEREGFIYDFNIAEEEYILEVDEVKLTRAISNLVDNSIKYNEKNTKLSISSTRKDDEVEIIIKDNGKGIDKEVRSKIFEAFVREDRARNSSTGGTGLGLAITKAIVEKHNGTITLIDTTIGTEYKIVIKMVPRVGVDYQMNKH